MRGGAPPPSAPMLTQKLANSGWTPGVAHREMSVVMGGVHPRNTGLAHRARGVVGRRGVENPRTTGGEVRHGLEDLESDSHRLRGAGCSNWAPSTLGPRIQILLKKPDNIYRPWELNCVCCLDELQTLWGSTNPTCCLKSWCSVRSVHAPAMAVKRRKW